MSAKRISNFPQFFQIFAPSNSVARVHCARVQKILLRPNYKSCRVCNEKKAKKRGRSKSETFAVVTFVLFRKQLNEFNARNAHDKVITAGGSNNAGFGGGAIFTYILV